MPYYRFTMKSEELRGASQPNIAYVILASDADAAKFAANLEVAFSADCVTVDSELARNYALPYPTGTEDTCRLEMQDGTGGWFNALLRNWATGADPVALSAALVAGGVLMPNYLIAPVSIVARVVPLGPSV